MARPTPATTIRERHDQSYPGVLDPAPLACRHVQSGGRSVGRLVLEPAADRRRARHHEQAGAGQYDRPGLSPTEIEKQVTLRIETALAGIPGLESTRSLSRNGFSQVTAIFAERTDIYFARQQISERLIELRARSSAGCRAAMGPISTGLGEIYMWAVDYASGAADRARAAGTASDGSYITPDGQRLTSEVERAAFLRTVQDWTIRPQLRGVRALRKSTPSADTSNSTKCNPIRLG